MINKNKLLENIRIKYSNNPLVEYSFSDLSGMSDPKRKNRSKTMSAFYKGITQGPDGNARTIWDVPSQSDSSVKYESVVEVVVPTNGGLFAVAKGKWEPKKFSAILAKSDVKVWCSCPDFYWSGMKYNLGPNGKLKGSVVPNKNAGHSGSGMKEQTVVSNAPDVRDPDRRQVLCKHLLTVFSVFPSNSFSIMSNAKKFDIKVDTNTKLTKDADDGKSTLAETVETVDVPKESATSLLDSLSQSTEQLAKSDAGEIIDEENISVTEPIETDASEVIDDENKATEEPETTEEVEGDATEVIDDINKSAMETDKSGASEIIDDLNISKESDVTEDTEDTDVSDVLDTWNKIAQSTINIPK